MKRPGYMMIKEAAARYSVSRAKLHRMIQLGRLQTSKDPRDERVTLLRAEDLEALFRFPREEAGEMTYQTGAAGAKEPEGGLTPELMARMDALRTRAFRGQKLARDSADIIREEREKRSRQIDEAVFGAEDREDADAEG